MHDINILDFFITPGSIVKKSRKSTYLKMYNLYWQVDSVNRELCIDGADMLLTVC